jgi:peroxiredoxin (alkyl hydroperoxide reductase subunit C)
LQDLLFQRHQVGLAKLQYPLLSDLNQTITKNYHLLTHDGLSLRGAFIIDKEGIIQYYNVNNLLWGRNIDELLRVLKSIQYIKENPGQACPVNWKNND